MPEAEEQRRYGNEGIFHSQQGADGHDSPGECIHFSFLIKFGLRRLPSQPYFIGKWNFPEYEKTGACKKYGSQKSGSDYGQRQ